MLPRGYRSLIVCDTRRAEAWRAGLLRAGFDVVLAETAPDNDKGAWEVGVAEAQALPAMAFVSDVVQGRGELPGPPIVSSTAFKALVAIAAVLVALFVIGWLTHLF